MDITVLIGLAAAFFIVGIFFIIKGASTEEVDAVPISNPKEIAELKNSYMAKDVQKPAAFKSKTADNAPAALELEIEDLRKENARMRTSLTEKISQYEEQIAQIKKRHEHLVPDRELIEELKSKGELFEKWQAENETKQVALRESIAQLEAEKAELQRSQKMGVDPDEFKSITNRLESSIQAIELLKGENKELKQFNETLKADAEKAKQRNVHLIEKEKIMEYELSKNRAQSLGLEKLCEGFKRQIEKLTSVTSAK